MLTPLVLLALTSLAQADDSTGTDAPADGDTFSDRHPESDPNNGNVRHGIRIGYVYLNQSELAGLKDPSLFGVGWEGEFRMIGSESVDFILVTNVMALGMNQGLLLPTGNLLFGAHIGNMVEFGAGVNASLAPTPALHMIVAGAVTPKVGTLQLPIALSYVPDVDGFWKVGLTVGVNWGAE